MVKITRRAEHFAARFVSPVGIYPCIGARTTASNRALQDAYTAGGADEVRSLRVDDHEVQPACWLHRGMWCLSTLEPDTAAAAVQRADEANPA